MLAIVVQTGSVPLRFEFGAPLMPDDSVEAYVRWVLADDENRRDALWDIEILDARQTVLRLLGDASDEPRELVPLIQALGSFGRPQGTEIVVRHLEHANDEVQRASIRSLGQMGQFSTMEEIEPFLEHPDRGLRREALIALGKFGRDSILPKLEQAAANDAELRTLVEQAQSRIAAFSARDFPGIVDALLGTEEYEDLLPLAVFVKQPLVDVLLDRRRDALARTQAIRVLGLRRVRKAGWNLKKILADEQEPLDLRREAALAIGRCRLGTAVDSLIELLDSDDQSMQQAAVDALGRIGRARTLDPLLRKWDARDGALREYIRLAIRRIASASGSQSFTELLRSGGALRTEAVVIVDDDLNLSRSFRHDLVGARLESENVEARRDAALLLAFFGNREDAENLASLREREVGGPNREIAEMAFNRLSRGRGGNS